MRIDYRLPDIEEGYKTLVLIRGLEKHSFCFSQSEFGVFCDVFKDLLQELKAKKNDDYVVVIIQLAEVTMDSESIGFIFVPIQKYVSEGWFDPSPMRCVYFNGERL